MSRMIPATCPSCGESREVRVRDAVYASRDKEGNVIKQCFSCMMKEKRVTLHKVVSKTAKKRQDDLPRFFYD